MKHSVDLGIVSARFFVGSSLGSFDSDVNVLKLVRGQVSVCELPFAAVVALEFTPASVFTTFFFSSLLLIKLNYNYN